MAKQNIDEVISEIKADLKGENVYSKLQKCRYEISRMNLKKSGVSKGAKFSFKYYELADFLTPAIELFNKYRLCPVFSDGSEYCTMEIYNSDNPEEIITFRSLNADAKLLGGATAIQERGSLQTYQRRYLYIMALDIVEADSIDGGAYNGEKSYPQQPQQPKYISNNEIGEIQKQLLDIKATEKQISWLFDVLKVDSFDMILQNDLPKAKTAIGKITETNKEKSNGN